MIVNNSPVKSVVLVFLGTFLFSSAFAERYRISEDSFGELAAEKVEPGETISEAFVEQDELVDGEKEYSQKEPITDEREAIADQEKPLAEQQSSLADERKPLVDEKKALLEQLKPSADQVEQSTIREESIADRQESLTGQEHHLDDGERPLAHDQVEEEEASSKLSETADRDDISEGVKQELLVKEKSISIFEQKYLEGLEQEKQEVLDLIRRNESSNKIDVTDVSTEKFVDGDATEDNGGFDPDAPSPYFIQIDADGKPYITPYDPALEKAFRKSQQGKKYEFTDATIYQRSQEQKSLLNIPSAADPIAKQILMSGENSLEDYFTEFSKSCCEQLINKNVETLEKDRAYFFELTDDDLPYRFREGDSRYLLIKLPRSTHENYPLRFRTFVRSYKSRGIAQGVFFPEIVTLDKDKLPMRIISGPLLKYVPESWTKYGYLEGIFEIDQTREREETYLLAKTNKKILKETSTIVSDDEIVTIEHLNYGSFEVEILLD